MARVPEIIRRNPISQVAADPKPTGLGWSALADLAQIGADFVKPAALKQAADNGLKSVYRDANGVLKVTERNVLGGELADAHNSAAFAKYLAQRQIDMSQTFTELAQKNQFNPAGFRADSDAYIRLLTEDEDVPLALKEDLLLTAQREAQTRFNGLYAAETNRTYNEADRNTLAARDMLVDDYVNLFMGGDVEGAAAKYAEIEELTRFRENAAYISDTPAERDAYLRGVRGAAKVARLSQMIQETDGATELSDPIRAEIDSIMSDPDIDPDSRRKLYALTQGRLKGVDAAAIVTALTSETFEARVNRANADMSGIPGLAGLNADFSPRLQAMFNAAPPEIRAQLSINSGYRSVEQQTVLWNQALAKYGSVEEARKWVAPPGNSQHNSGNAADLGFGSDEARQWVHANAAAFGLHFRLDNEDWHIEAMPGAPALSGSPDRTANAAALTEAGVQISDDSEFLALAFGVTNAIGIMSADPDAIVRDIVGEPENLPPLLANMTAEQARNWAIRQMTVKASDIAAQQVVIDQIPDTEVRGLATRDLNDRYGVRARMEEQAALGYRERLAANDDTLTTQEIMSDHSLSDAMQQTLVNEWTKINKAAIEVQGTIAGLASGTATYDPYDSTGRGKVNDAFVSMLGDDAPLSERGQLLAGEIAMRTGYMPQRAFNAIRGAVNGNDPAALASSMEFLNQLIQRQPNAIGMYDGRTEVLDALADYTMLSETKGAEAAAAQMLEAHSPEAKARLANLSDAAKAAAKTLSEKDVTSFFGERGVKVNLDDVDVAASVMGDYERMFLDAYTETGDTAMARNRALNGLARVYGADTVTGTNRMMKYPPQLFYPASAEHPNWMQDQLVEDVSRMVYGDERVDTFLSADAFGLTADGTRPEPLMAPNDIIIMSDEKTRSEIAAGMPPSYLLRYIDADGLLQQMPKRFYFDPAASQAADAARNAEQMLMLQRGQAMEQRLRDPATMDAALGLEIAPGSLMDQVRQ